MIPRPKLDVENLSKSYVKNGATLDVLQNVSMTVRDNEFVTIVGASGCGKTTFLRLIDGLIQPSSGSVTIDGQPVTKPGAEVAFVFQQDGLLPWRTVAGNTVLGPEFQGGPIRKAREVAQGFLRLVGLEGFDVHFPHELSGGMRQRVNLARALTVGSDVLLMDEPFAALDAQTRIIMQDELMRICRETRKTVLFVTHQIDEAVFLSDRVLIFTARPGRLKQEVVIDLPRPRELDIKWSKAFVDYTNLIWHSIEEEVRTSIGIDMRRRNSQEN